MPEKKTIYEAVAAVIEEMSSIGKTGRNKEQGYNFRGIDAVLIELHPLFAKHGIFFAPTVIERLYEERLSKQGNIGHCAHLHVAYKVYGPSGDFIELSTWGEGLDYSDKATNKAMTAAFKYAMFELFAICDPAEDSDATTEDGGERTGNVQRSRPNVDSQGNPDIRIEAILKAADQATDNGFLQSLKSKYAQYGRFTEPQLEKGFEAASKILGGERQFTQRAVPNEPPAFEYADEADRF